jgi:hypothetical protein
MELWDSTMEIGIEDRYPGGERRVCAIDLNN